MAKSGGRPRRLKRDGVDTNELSPGGRTQLQMRELSSGRISKRQVQTFFAALADTCNVKLSAREAGFTVQWAYLKRRTDAGFRAAWAEAVAEGYAKLELVLLERALTGTEKITIRRDGSEERVREYPNAIALQLLRRHRETAAEADMAIPEEEAAELRKRLLDKLERLRKREEGKCGPPAK